MSRTGRQANASVNVPPPPSTRPTPTTNASGEGSASSADDGTGGPTTSVTPRGTASAETMLWFTKKAYAANYWDWRYGTHNGKWDELYEEFEHEVDLDGDSRLPVQSTIRKAFKAKLKEYIRRYNTGLGARSGLSDSEKEGNELMMKIAEKMVQKKAEQPPGRSRPRTVAPKGIRVVTIADNGAAGPSDGSGASDGQPQGRGVRRTYQQAVEPLVVTASSNNKELDAKRVKHSEEALQEQKEARIEANSLAKKRLEHDQKVLEHEMNRLKQEAEMQKRNLDVQTKILQTSLDTFASMMTNFMDQNRQQQEQIALLLQNLSK